ncbi:MAG TPA: arylsulfatase [Bryobacteraceae bacterium]|nr:arylsulfatase [Bryobacteraceae bacterium]
MTRRTFLQSGVAALVAARRAPAAEPRPNIVMLLADDLGYGDTSCYGAQRVHTPNIDRLAQHGVRFTDAHTSAATCTPSRYSILTGEYAFRVPDAKILPGDAPALIQPGRVTLASLLRERGYRTAAIGKWHLGLGNGNLDWNADIKPGPLEIGFDECFIIPATGDRVPCVFVENHRVANLDPKDPIKVDYHGPLDDSPTGRTHPELLKMKPSHGHDMTIVNGISRIGYMSGGKSALWNDETMADTLTNRAISFIERGLTGRSTARPFFLYFATHDIHVPRDPNRRFRDSTTMGPRGNVIAELDWCVGKLVETLERRGLLANTLLVFSSDNGGVVDDGYQDDAVAKLGSHRPNGPLRGGKYSNFEGGTRVPMIVHWPARVKPGVSDALVSQVDLLRSWAQLTGASLGPGAGADSQNLLPAMLGESRRGRQLLVEQAGDLSLRDGTWKYISPGTGPKIEKNTNTEMGTDPGPQLYDLAADLGETRNLAARQPARVTAMAEKLRRIRGASA